MSALTHALSRPVTRRFLVGAVLTAAIIALVAVRTGGGSTASATDDGTATARPDRIILNPTTDAATSQTVTWRTDEATEDGEVQVAPADDPDAVRTVEADESIAERLPAPAWSHVTTVRP